VVWVDTLGRTEPQFGSHANSSVPDMAREGKRRALELNSIQQQFLDTWKLVSYVREEIPSGAESDVMGVHPSGYINYGRDGRMIVLIVGSDRKEPAGAAATPEEAEALIRTMLSYAGAYTVDSEARTVTHLHRRNVGPVTYRGIPAANLQVAGQPPYAYYPSGPSHRKQPNEVPGVPDQERRMSPGRTRNCSGNKPR
jgi:hypothetical protein